MRTASCLLAVTILAGVGAFGCGGKSGAPVDAQPDGGSDAQPPHDTDGGPVADIDAGPKLHTASKVDLLFMIDNSASMGDKQELLRQAVPDLLHRLVSPNCVSAAGTLIGPSVNATCATGKLEFQPVKDIHVGIVSSSLGGRGGDQCDPKGVNPVSPGLSRHNDDKGHLINRAGGNESPVAAAGASNFLAWTPADGSADALTQNFQDMLTGVHEYGCGLEAQLESWYRFLIQPDPYAEIVADPSDPTMRKRALSGIDEVILKQRHDFLRPDSLVAVVLITDEDDSAVDPQSVGGQGWAYENSKFPGSCGGGPARGTAACDDVTTVATDACTSCGLPGHESDPGCQKAGDTCSDPNNPGVQKPQLGYYSAAEDVLNTRMVHMKQRYGFDPQFPLSRYVDGLTSRTVPDRGNEHAMNGTYVGTKACTNPLFAKNLPTDPQADLCHLEQGPRGTDLVYYGIIGGVPHQLLQEDPQNPDSPPKNALSAADWKKIVGNNPAAYDYTGADPHMWQAIKPNDGPRAGLPPPNAADTADPASGREWDSGGVDLQYACTFALPTPRDCADPKLASACDCGPGRTPPLCAAGDPAKARVQVRGKAYPAIRELAVASQLKQQGIAASICPIHTTEALPGDPLYGYRPAMRSIVDRFKSSLVPAE